jgi:hypothetical protein
MSEMRTKRLCPDPVASRHVACGYPSTWSQPDGMVNEEWFGLSAIERPCEDADQIRPREAFFNLQRLWTMGSCVKLAPGYGACFRQLTTQAPLPRAI